MDRIYRIRITDTRANLKDIDSIEQEILQVLLDYGFESEFTRVGPSVEIKKIVRRKGKG